MANNVRGGLLAVKVDGVAFSGVGNFTYNQGKPLRTSVTDATGPSGYSISAQVPFVEGEFRDGADVDLDALTDIDDATVTLELANGKTFVLANAYYVGEGTGNTQDGNFAVRFESRKQGQFV